MLKVIPMRKKYLKVFRELIDRIAKERKYLLILKAPSLKKYRKSSMRLKRITALPRLR